MDEGPFDPDTEIADLESKAKMLIDKKKYIMSFKKISHAIHLKQTNNYPKDDIHTQVVEMAKLFNQYGMDFLNNGAHKES